MKSNQPTSKWYAIPTNSRARTEDENSEGGIELSTWTSKNNSSIGLTGSVAFSFVSLDNLVSSSGKLENFFNENN